MKKLLLLLFLAYSQPSGSYAQAPFNTIDSININQINASVALHGDMWWNPASSKALCFFPNTTSKTLASVGALWLAGYDASNNLHIAAQTYRQKGNDYWPGPGGSVTYSTSSDWAKIWKINRSDITAFLALSSHTALNTPAAIWTWPAKGNVHAAGNGGAALTITDDMAPFVDLNGDGIYQPDMGEYPDFKGDQALWWVFSDNGPSHTETNGLPLGVEVHGMAYAYSRGSAIDRVVYYQYTIVNKSANNYQNFRAGIYADVDLGDFSDDYVGYDSTRALGIVYNGKSTDAVYGNNIPMAGVILLGLTGGPIALKAASFIYNNNDPGSAGVPSAAAEYNNYLRATFKGGMHVTNDFAASGIHTVAYGSGPQTNFAFFGDPSDHTQWSECNSGNTPGDRRFIISSGDDQLNAGGSLTFTVALVTTGLGTQNACGDTGVSFANIRDVADVATYVYDGGAVPGTTGVKTVIPVENLSVYPNPAHDKITIEKADNIGIPTIVIYNSLGQIVNVPIYSTARKSEAQIGQLPAGLYNILYRSGNFQTTGKFLKYAY